MRFFTRGAAWGSLNDPFLRGPVFFPSFISCFSFISFIPHFHFSSFFYNIYAALFLLMLFIRFRTWRVLMRWWMPYNMLATIHHTWHSHYQKALKYNQNSVTKLFWLYICHLRIMKPRHIINSYVLMKASFTSSSESTMWRKALYSHWLCLMHYDELHDRILCKLWIDGKAFSLP